MKITAIIPAKGTSTRLPGKNMQPFGNSTLLGHKIDQLLQVSAIDEVVVGSDSDEILAFAAARGATPRKRDAYHCDEQACPLRERWRNLVAMVECDVVVWAHCTNPLVTPDIYERAIRAYQANTDQHDSLCSVTTIRRHAWMDGDPINFDPWEGPHPFARDLTPFLFQDGAIFIQPHQQMLANGYFYGRNPLLFDVPQPFGLDVDTGTDLAVARAIYAAAQAEVAV